MIHLTSSAPPRPNIRIICATFFSSFICICLLYMLTKYSGMLWIMAPFGATCVLTFALPDSPLAQPRHVIGGHFITSLIALIVLSLMGDSLFAQAFAVASGIIAMQILRVTHPPAGANPLVIMTLHASWSFLFFPVLLGTLAIIAITYCCHRLCKRNYPIYWY